MARALKRHSPSVHVAFLIQRYTSEIVEGDPGVDQVVYYDDGERNLPFFRLAAGLRREHFDAVIHTHPRFRLALMTWFARIPVRVGTGYRWYSFLFNRRVFEHRKDARRHELEYNLSLLESIGCPVEFGTVLPDLRVQPEALAGVEALLSRLGVKEDERVVVVHPGSGRSARDWSAKNFGLLARLIADLPNVRLVITGGKSEEAVVGEVAGICGKSAIPIVDRLNLREYAALAKISSLFIANSTGPLHMAAAVGTPVIGLYPQVTPLNATRWGPYTEKKTVFSPVGKPEDCARCLAPAAAGCECMDSITVEEVFRASREYLKPE